MLCKSRGSFSIFKQFIHQIINFLLQFFSPFLINRNLITIKYNNNPNSGLFWKLILLHILHFIIKFNNGYFAFKPINNSLFHYFTVFTAIFECRSKNNSPDLFLEVFIQHQKLLQWKWLLTICATFSGISC